MSRHALWPSKLLMRLLFLLGGRLIGLELGVEHGEYDPHEAQRPYPCRQADPQNAIEGVPVGLADHEGCRDRDVEERQFGPALGCPDRLAPVGLSRSHRHSAYNSEWTQWVEQSQCREHAATELSEPSEIGPGASRPHT